VIEAQHLVKRYGAKTAVDDLSFTVSPGHVTGFLGPNGAGKSTTMRMVVGLDRPTSGTVVVNGKPYAEHRTPLAEVGTLLEAKAVHKGRSAHDHLLALAQSQGIGRARVAEVIDLVGLHDVARKRAGGFSLGMGQRLGIASALLGDPATIILDEPVNGLDPDGVLWIRTLLRGLAAEGRTVFVSSHLMSEMALTAERLVIVGRGRLLADTTVEDLISSASDRPVVVHSPQAGELGRLLVSAGATVTDVEVGELSVTGTTAARIGEVAAERGIVLHELHTERASLEQVYMALTRDSREYTTDEPGTGAPTGASTGATSQQQEVAA